MPGMPAEQSAVPASPPCLKAEALQRQWAFEWPDGRVQAPVSSQEVLKLHLGGALSAEQVLWPDGLRVRGEAHSVRDWLVDLLLDVTYIAVDW